MARLLFGIVRIFMRYLSVLALGGVFCGQSDIIVLSDCIEFFLCKIAFMVMKLKLIVCYSFLM